ncbi:MAG TPA: YihY/virulence factor BrkB family protein [Thermoleophilaceae bacterium]|nr:YihY/virulence factor BrkB family protein [Thermoleophilaceae bacterium]
MGTAAAKASARAELRGALRELVGAFSERHLLVWASALSFRVAMSLVPFLLFGFALIGFLHLESAWTGIAKDIKPHMSDAAFKIVDSTAKKVVTQKQGWWLTLGFALAMWEVSGGIRTIMGGLNLIYELREKRSWIERMLRSILIAVAVSVLVLAAVGVAWAGPLLYGDVGQPLGALLFVARWAIAALLLGSAVAITVRLAPDGYQPAAQVTVGTAIVVGIWIAASILFGLYIRYVASYGSIFGNLATIVLLFAYIYISSIAFFAGAQIDAIIRERVEGNPQGR